MRFEAWNGGVDALSAEELDRIAVDQYGIVGSIGWCVSLVRGLVPEERHGYGFDWIATRGVANSGTLVLTARSDRAAALLAQGMRAGVEAAAAPARDADYYHEALRALRGLLEDGVDMRYAHRLGRFD